MTADLPALNILIIIILNLQHRLEIIDLSDPVFRKIPACQHIRKADRSRGHTSPHLQAGDRLLSRFLFRILCVSFRMEHRHSIDCDLLKDKIQILVRSVLQIKTDGALRISCLPAEAFSYPEVILIILNDPLIFILCVDPDRNNILLFLPCGIEAEIFGKIVTFCLFGFCRGSHAGVSFFRSRSHTGFCSLRVLWLFQVILKICKDICSMIVILFFLRVSGYRKTELIRSV